MDTLKKAPERAATTKELLMNWLESPERVLAVAAVGVCFGFAIIALGLNLLNVAFG